MASHGQPSPTSINHHQPSHGWASGGQHGAGGTGSPPPAFDWRRPLAEVAAERALTRAERRRQPHIACPSFFLISLSPLVPVGLQQKSGVLTCPLAPPWTPLPCPTVPPAGRHAPLAREQNTKTPQASLTKTVSTTTAARRE